MSQLIIEASRKAWNLLTIHSEERGADRWTQPKTKFQLSPPEDVLQSKQQTPEMVCRKTIVE